MPKATVDEHCHTFSQEYEVWFAEYFGVSSPPSNLVGAECCDQTQLGITIASAADARHDGATLFRCENVRHVEPTCY
jgi:hypothetical protein